MRIVIELTDAEATALSVVALSAQDWAETALRERARLAIGDIVQSEMAHLSAAGEPIPPSVEAILAGALASGRVTTAAARRASLAREIAPEPGADAAR
ncbi:MAG: hypothetical protein JO048_14225 [Methylobacteriaceae bacterium]|nr:hypothetical protein [Methylobacteriaceae bacterium]